MDVSATTTQNTPNGIYALKKAMEVEQNSVAKILDDSATQQQQLQEQQAQQTQKQQQQQVAQMTGLGINLNVTA